MVHSYADVSTLVEAQQNNANASSLQMFCAGFACLVCLGVLIGAPVTAFFSRVFWKPRFLWGDEIGETQKSDYLLTGLVWSIGVGLPVSILAIIIVNLFVSLHSTH